MRISAGRTSRRCAAMLVGLLAISHPVAAQDRGAAALGALVSGLSGSGRVLVIGAHPDDEDAQILTWLTRGRHVETAYLSLTRGDGGQNLIGNELGEALGAIRTEELLAARRVDGGRQYFARAYDFGFSRSAAETFQHWPHDSLLRDAITVVRAFRPHVIISVFTGTARDGHGHHQASGIIGREVYDLAGDTVRFPRAATEGHGPWTPLKFYRGATSRPDAATLRINVGEYDPLRGRSYAELAAVSRSQHRSQAFGTLERKGVRYDQVQREASRVPVSDDPRAERSLFEGIDTTWARFRDQVGTAEGRAALDALPVAFAAVLASFDAFAPERTVPALGRVARLLMQLCGSLDGGVDNTCDQPGAAPAGTGTLPRDIELPTARSIALGRVHEALALAAGVSVEVTAEREVWALGEAVPFQIVVYNRGRLPVSALAYSYQIGDSVHERDLVRPGAPILPDSTRTERGTGTFTRPTQPWWLVTPRAGAMFSEPIRGIDEREQRRDQATASVTLSVQDVMFALSAPVVFRFADPVKGEVNRPIAGAPAVTILLDTDVEYAQANATIDRSVRVHLRSAATGARDVEVSLRLPNGLAVDSAMRQVTLPGPGTTRTVTFRVRGRVAPGRHSVEAVAAGGGETFTTGFVQVAYEHIRTQRLYRPSTLRLEGVDLKLPAARQIAYIPGVGDNSAPVLEQLGLNVTVVEPELIPRIDLSGFSAIVVGPRAYEASAALVANNARLLDYVQKGGTMVVQYGQYEMMQPGIMPYPVTINRPHDRVTVEGTPVRILDPSAPVLTAPNRITERDFDGWVQDRSLYMPRTFDERYRAVLELSDPGEPTNRGAILVAPHGRGTYVYTSLAFFRQLPNGVPGAARLFVNLIAAKAGRVVP